jgi:hypothetical protein
VTLGIKTKGAECGVKKAADLQRGLLLPRGPSPGISFAEIFNIFGIADIFVIRAL